MKSVRTKALIKNGKPVGYDPYAFSKFYKKNEGKHIFLIAQEEEPMRSTDHNAFYWAHILDIISDYTGFSKIELHNEMKKRFNPKGIFVLDFENKTKTSESVGGTTTKLSIKKFSKFVEDVKLFGESLGCIFDEMERWIAEHPDQVEHYAAGSI